MEIQQILGLTPMKLTFIVTSEEIIGLNVTSQSGYVIQ